MNDNADPLEMWFNEATVLDTPEPEVLEAMLEAARLSTVFMVKTPTPETPGAPGCWLGGAPTLPPEIAWPWVQNAPTPEQLHDLFRRTGQTIHTEYSLRNPMNFLGQIDLEQVPPADRMPDLPATGTLFFFVDYVCPVERFDRNPMYRVIYVDDDVSHYPPRQEPDFPADFETETPAYWWTEEPKTSFDKWPVTFQLAESWDHLRYPNRAFENAAIDMAIKSEDHVRNRAHKDQSINGPIVPGRPRGDFQNHYLFGPHKLPDQGFPASIQRLFSLDSDLDIGFTGERLAFFIETDALAARRFEDAFAYTLNG